MARASSRLAALALTLALAGACAPPPSDGNTRRTNAGGGQVGVATALDKVRPDFPVPSVSEADIEAARNEFEPFQIVVAGPVTGLRATATALTGPQGATIPVDDVRLYRVELYNVLYASDVEGAAGEWPDPLIPDVDTYFNEQRNAFPFDVRSGTTRAIWVEVFVPRGIPAGAYDGSVTLSASAGLATTTVPVHLRVRDFDLPSTASLKSAFGFSVDLACRAHDGTTYCNTDAQAEPYVEVYGRAALEHRISFWNAYYQPPSHDLGYFDTVGGTFMAGTAPTRLAGARNTTLADGTRDASADRATAQHFAQQGWTGLFDYTCDEPPMTCAWSDIAGRASGPQSAGIPTLVTTNIDDLTQNGLLDAVDIVVPVLDQMQPPSLGSVDADNRGKYDSFLARGPQKQVWMYQSCDQHGCGGCDPSQASDPTHGWAVYVVDSSGVQNRAMEWLSYRFRVSAELYWETLFHIDDAWNSYEAGHTGTCDFGGTGDGQLFYAGTPSRIGGTHHIPVESQRLKLVREGMEDYEYLHLLDTLGGGDVALAEDKALFPAAYQVAQATPAQLYAARSRLADAIEQRLGTSSTGTGSTGAGTSGADLSVPRASGPVDVHGNSDAIFAAATPITVAAGAAQATLRLVWDDTALYVDATVTDPLLRTIGAGRDGELWDADGVEVMLDPGNDRSAAPDLDDRHVIVTVAGDLLDARGAGTGEDRSLTMGIDESVTRDGNLNDGSAAIGYHVTMAIPWSGIGVAPQAGLEVGADLALNDLGASALSSSYWAGINPFAQPSRWRRIQLAAASSSSSGSDGGTTSSSSDCGGCSLGGAPTHHATGDDGNASLVGGCSVGGRSSTAGFALALIALALVGLRRRRRCAR